MLVEMCLASNYYIFSTYFKKIHNNKKNKDEYPSWHDTSDLREASELKNVRPLQLVPVVSLNDVGQHELWATDSNYRLCSLRHGNQGKEGKSDKNFSILAHSCPIHTLSDGTYKLKFPPLPMLAKLAQGGSSYENLCESINKISKKIIQDDISYKLTTISLDQLAEPYKSKTNGELTSEQKKYNSWLKEVKDKGESLKGFILPTVSTIAVVFSHQDYQNAIVSLHSYDEFGKDKFGYELTSKAEVFKSSDNEESKPCAIFHLNPDEIEDGLFTIRVKINSDETKDKKIPILFQKSNIESYSIGLTKEYSYELREYIKFNSDSPLGKIAIVNGDMISLEETLIYQFPQYLNGMKRYLSNDKGAEGASSPTLNSLSTLKSIRDASVQFGVDSLIGGLQGQYIEAGKKAALNSVSQVFWDSVNNDMPEALRATGELYHGIFSVKDAWEHYSKLFNDNLTKAERGLGASALFSEKVLDVSKGKEFFQGFKKDIESKNFTSLSGRVAETWNGGLSGLAENGLNFISTAQSMMDLYDNYKNMIEAENKTKNARKDFTVIAGDYLDKIPVYRENIFQDAKKINEALESAKKKIADSSKLNDGQTEVKDQVELITDERGTGIKVLFHFNSRKRELDENKGVIDVLVEALKSERKLRIEIEGHACQVSSDAINMRVSKERAENAKALFPEDLHQFITVRAYGESAPIYIPDDPKDIRRDNPKLAVNRRVVIKIYLVSLDIVYSPSRFGYQAMERYRLSALNAMKNEDDAETALQLAVLDSFLNVAEFIPVLAPFARGLMLASASGDVIKSALTVLDETLFDHNIKEYFKKLEKINSLVNLSKLNMEMLRDVHNINIDLNQSHSTYEEVEKFLKDKKTNQELLKRYKLRAFALNGLMHILAWLKFHCKEINQENLEKYRVKEYLSTYIFSDDWKVHAYTRNLGLNWINTIKMEGFYNIKNNNSNIKERSSGVQTYTNGMSYNTSGLYVAPLPMQGNMYVTRVHKEVSGAFNRVFPVQTKLFEQGDESLFVEFANNFSIIKGAIRSDNIGFCRLLIAEPNSENWKSYPDWLDKKRSNRISPYHKVKLQLVLNTKYDQVMAVKFGYDRIDGLWSLDGPTYEALVYPMKITDFTCDPGGELADYFEKQQSETLSSVEFTPFYTFGEAKIFGMKPLTSKGRIIFNEFTHDLKESVAKTFYFYNKLMASLGIIEEDKEVGDFERYVNEGGFRTMKYRLWISDSDGDFKMYLPKWFSDKKYGTDIIRLLNKNINIGVHSENKSEVTVYRDFGETALHLREKDTLHELFTLTTDTKNAQPVPIIEDIAFHVVGIKSKETGLNLFTKSGEMKDYYLSKHRLASRKNFSDLTSIEENPTSIFVMFLAEKDNIEHYKTTKLAWDKLDMSLQLILGMDDAIFSSEKINHGPTYSSTLCFQGKLSFSEYHEMMNKSYGTSYETWRWEDEISDGKKVHYSDELDNFVKVAMDKIKSESDDLDENKTYTMYALEVPLSYFSPTGKKVNGLRPFGDILSSGKLTLSLAVSQSDTANQEVYSGLSEIGIEIQPIGNGLLYAPWLQEPESEKDIDKDAVERWKLLSESEKRTLVQHWIKEQRTVLEAPSDPNPSLIS